MEEERRCEGCAKVFRPRNKARHYCLDPSCRRIRKRRWQKRKIAADPEYKGNQADAQRIWRNPQKRILPDHQTFNNLWSTVERYGIPHIYCQ